MDMRNEPRTSAQQRVIPERVREAREARGLTPEDFAEALGVTRQAVGQYEIGQTTPSAEVMGKIISITEQPPVFFTTERARGPSKFRRPFWRSLKRMELKHRKRIGRRLEWAHDIVRYIEQFIELPEPNFPAVEFSWSDFDLNAGERIEEIAEALREFWDLGATPLLDLEKILEANGIVLIRETVTCDDMDAVSRWQNGRPYILYSADVKSTPRCLFNLAHELGHLVLHADVEVDSDNINQIEKQADRFAAAFLLPRDTFSREVIGSSLNHFIYLKERWGVSIGAMIYRAKDLEIISKHQHTYLIKQMNARKIRVREPLDDFFPPPIPTILARSIKMLIEHNVQSEAQIEAALSLNLRDIESLCGVEHGFLDRKVVNLELHPKFKAK